MHQLTDNVLEVHRRLCKAYGCPVAFFHNFDPLSELVSSLLSHRTRNADSSKAFKALRAAMPTWEEVRDAAIPAIQQAIQACTWPEQKAPRLQAILSAITQECGSLSLDFLRDHTVSDARAWLEKLPGIGPKTSAAVLLFSHLRMRAMPVDSHHYRVAVRLGIIPASLGEGKAHRVLENLLPESWGAQQVYDHHEVMMFHGQRCCHWRNPKCAACVLNDMCPTGQERFQTSDKDPLLIHNIIDILKN